MPTFLFHLSSGTLEQLRQYAAQQSVPMGQVIRYGLQVAQQRPPKGGWVSGYLPENVR